MGEDAVAVVSRWTERAARGEVAAHLWHPDAEIVNARGWVVDVTYHGRAGLQQWWDDVAEAFSDFRFVPMGLEPVGGDRVLSRQRLVGTFRASGIATDLPWCCVVTVREGLIVRAVGYLSVREARAALEAEPG